MRELVCVTPLHSFSTTVMCQNSGQRFVGQPQFDTNTETLIGEIATGPESAIFRTPTTTTHSTTMSPFIDIYIDGALGTQCLQVFDKQRLTQSFKIMYSRDDSLEENACKWSTVN